MANAHQSEPDFKVVVERDQMMRTRDGVCLRADVYRPDAPGRFPILLVRTPYDKGAGMALTEKDYFPPRGYVVVVQDTRGRHSSEGDFYPFVHEARDGCDAVEWAAALPCSDGNAPRRMLSTASSMVAKAVRKTTDKAGSLSCTAARTSRPSPSPIF